MAKRGAEALACRAPCHSLLSHAPAPKRSRADFERREPRCVALQSGDKKRKRAWAAEEEKEAEAEAAAPRGKRSAGMKAPLKEQGWALGARPLEGAAQCQGLARRSREAEAAASGENWRGCPPPKASAEHEDDVWHYNSFQYWRSPIPTIDLTDILDLEKDDAIEARDSSGVGISEMET
ncbi:uncharacterized protein C9orf40 homolog isoform X2 [Varanus komodoensis]|uniref:uncharacterized protein C9orf40 homolog isoform X2 n=1 Tax=Varanus komodoensis TaxID=61221 RepID=UPI001CF767E3|nr:uncharacterized protein C9orf40 homolog isoform X2 [Varanus komodoensis]